MTVAIRPLDYIKNGEIVDDVCTAFSSGLAHNINLTLAGIT